MAELIPLSTCLPIAAAHTCSYEVRKKKKGLGEEMAELILSKFTTKVQPGNRRSWAVQVRSWQGGLGRAGGWACVGRGVWGEGRAGNAYWAGCLAGPAGLDGTHVGCPLTSQNASHTPTLSQCGIVYCLSRAECERVADDLEAQLAEHIFPLSGGRRRVK